MKPFVYLIPATAWYILILIASLISASNYSAIDVPIMGVDKIVHFGLYFILSVLVCWGIYKLNVLNSKKRIAVYSAILCGFCGFIVEILQSTMTTTRSFDFYDIVANIFGCSVGSVIFIFLNKQI